jgi:hypothetical protein
MSDESDDNRMPINNSTWYYSIPLISKLLGVLKLDERSNIITLIADISVFTS